jgi:hypothetical protein
VSGGDADPVVSAQVMEERGRFIVVFDAVFADGAVRHHVQSYHTRARAELAARLMQAAAEREQPTEWGMS